MLLAAKRHGLPVLAPVFNPDPVEAHRQRLSWLERGADHLIIGTDKIVFASAISSYAQSMR